MRFEPDDAQAPVLDLERGSLLVTGSPGCGKTTLLRERFARLVEAGVDPERILLLVLNRRAARESRERLQGRLARSLPALPVLTAHGFAFSVVGRDFEALGYTRPPEVLSASDQYAVVREMLRGERPADWPRFAPLLDVREFARQVADLCLRAQERLLGPDELEALAVDRSEYLEIAGFYRRYLDALHAANQTDFAGLLHGAVQLVRRGRVPEPGFEHVLVDDYQDATHATEAIVAGLAPAARSVVVAADPEGHVFSYRGGSLEPLERIGDVLGGLRRVELDGSHRLGPDVAALGRLPDVSEAERPPAARIRALEVPHPGEEAEVAARELLRRRVEDDVAWERMAVIVRRYGAYLTALRHALRRHGVPFVVVAEESAVAAEPANRPVVDLFRYVFQPEVRDELLEPLLGSRVGGLTPHQLRRLRREARVRRTKLVDLVEAPPQDLDRDLAEPLLHFRRVIEELPRVAEGRGPDGAFFWLWTEHPVFGGMVADADARARDLDALSAFGDVLGRFVERRPGAGVEDYLATLEAAEFGPDPWVLPEERHPHAVRVISAHRAHGIEVDVAVVMGSIEGEFPSLSHRAPMVDLDRLVAPRTAVERIRDRLDEERALFRLAVSRARLSTLLLASRSAGARNPRTPSRFAARLGLEWTRPERGAAPAASLREMEADLRRTLQDRTAPAPERLAALAALPETGADPRTWWWGRDWSDPGIPLHGEDEMYTSYSRLSSLENCALQYLYASEMGLDTDESFQMWLGSTVHEIIDDIQQGKVPRTEEAAHAELERRWDPDIFPNRAIEHRRFLDGKEMLSLWLTHESPEIVASEKSFSFPIDGARIRGRIDAIFRMNNGKVRVVDYKTSRWAPTKEDTRQSLQLAAYYLAMRRVEELAGYGEPGRLELHYLGKTHFREGYVRRSVIPSQEDDYEAWAEGRLRELVEAVRAESFAPNPQADCQFCSFKPICPMWPEGQEVTP
ncbi:MAG TPA: ATP-dependent DNA helicase [Actinomycetota bacterium]|nr:ATP-dependent DNA helicase [Actinomycetota bacterium]